jgi:hypothetical protein
MIMTEDERKLMLLDDEVRLNMTLNDLRIMVTSFRALEYLMRLHDECYLDADGLSLKDRLEVSYFDLLQDRGVLAGPIKENVPEK